MAQVKIGDAHGLYRVMVGLVDNRGYNYGTAGAGVAEGTLMSPYLMRYPKNAAPGLTDRTVVEFTGGDVWTGSYVYGITSLGSFSMTSSTVEADLIAMLGASSVDNTTNSRVVMFSENIMLPTPPQVFIIIVFRLQSKEVGQKGANKFMSYVLPRVWVAPKGVTGAPSFQSAGEYEFSVTPTIGDGFPWGNSFSSTNMNLQEDEGPMISFISDNPIHAIGYIAETGASSVTITLPFKPVGINIASPDSSIDPVQVYINGIQSNADSVTVANGQIVVSPISPAVTFTGGEYIGVFYETNYVPVV